MVLEQKCCSCFLLGSRNTADGVLWTSFRGERDTRISISLTPEYYVFKSSCMILEQQSCSCFLLGSQNIDNGVFWTSFASSVLIMNCEDLTPGGALQPVSFFSP